MVRIDLDTHSDSIFVDAAAPLLEPRHLDQRLSNIVAGRVDALLATVGALEDFRNTMELVGKWLEIERSHVHKIRIARLVSDIRAAKADGVTAIVIHFQGADPIEDELDFLNAFHACGLRVMQLTYNARNRLGDGCFEPTDAGLSKFGRKVIKRMEELSIAVDLAHAGVRTTLDAATVATKPIFISHANARALCDTPRNATDEMIRAVAASGGVIGVCAAPFFLVRDGQATLETLIDHVSYIGDLVGVEHVGLGLDFAEEDDEDYVYFGYDERYIPRPPWTYPAGIAGHIDAPKIASALASRGYSKDDVRGVLGEKFLRVFARVWGG